MMKSIIQTYCANKAKGVVLAAISFKELNSKALFTYRSEIGDEPYNDNQVETNKNLYQREFNKEHIKEIKKYIRESILDETYDSAIFPTSMLLAITIDSADIRQEENILEFELPYNFYIVDGQHRLFAMRSLYEDCLHSALSDNQKIQQYLEKYKFNCSILINYDLWEQATIFADVNFKQKKVNKSLYYDIYGSYYNENKLELKYSYIYIAHTLVKFLNEYENSPLQNMVKMLGKGNGLMSQAFLVEALFPCLSNTRGIWYFNAKDRTNEPNFRKMSNELISFFNAVKDTFSNDWPTNNAHKSIILKTTGIGALIRLMSFIHLILPTDILKELEKDIPNRLCKEYYSKVCKELQKIRMEDKEIFSFNGKFGNTSGKASEGKLFKYMSNIIQTK